MAPTMEAAEMVMVVGVGVRPLLAGRAEVRWAQAEWAAVAAAVEGRATLQRKQHKLKIPHPLNRYKSIHRPL